MPTKKITKAIDLTDSAIRKAISEARAHKCVVVIPDAHRLRLFIRPTGKATWQHRLDDPATKKEQIMTLGSYPNVTISAARNRRKENRTLIEEGVNPMAAKRKAKAVALGTAANTFAKVADAYLETRTDLAPRTLSKARWQLRAFLNPEIGSQCIGAITAPHLLAALRKIEKTGKLETVFVFDARAPGIPVHANSQLRFEFNGFPKESCKL